MRERVLKLIFNDSVACVLDHTTLLYPSQPDDDDDIESGVCFKFVDTNDELIISFRNDDVESADIVDDTIFITGCLPGIDTTFEIFSIELLQKMHLTQESKTSEKQVRIADHCIAHVWVPECEQSGCSEVEVGPDYYQANGTPICACGQDMSYSHTMVTVDSLKPTNTGS